jgi:hypothetical protein
MDKDSILKINSDLKSNIININIDDNTSIKTKLLDVPAGGCLGLISQAVGFRIEENYHAAVFADKNKVHILYTQNDPKVRIINIEFSNLENTTFNGDKAYATINNQNIEIKVFDGKIVSFKNNILSINSQALDLKIDIYLSSDFAKLDVSDDFQTLTVTSNIFVPIGSRGPEFSLGIFDRISPFSHPRPIRFGVPIISTVPSYNDSLTPTEQIYYDKGLGPDSKRMYFRLVCNQELSSDLPVKLLIYLPNGLDTVTVPDFINMTLISSSGQNSVYSGSYVFNKEDTTFTVDGFTYFSVYIDTIQQISIPLKVQDQAADFTKPTTDIDLF